MADATLTITPDYHLTMHDSDPDTAVICFSGGAACILQQGDHNVWLTQEAAVEAAVLILRHFRDYRLLDTN